MSECKFTAGKALLKYNEAQFFSIFCPYPFLPFFYMLLFFPCSFVAPFNSQTVKNMQSAATIFQHFHRELNHSSIAYYGCGSCGTSSTVVVVT
jgi:hypothetical protein